MRDGKNKLVWPNQLFGAFLKRKECTGELRNTKRPRRPLLISVFWNWVHSREILRALGSMALAEFMACGISH